MTNPGLTKQGNVSDSGSQRHGPHANGRDGLLTKPLAMSLPGQLWEVASEGGSMHSVVRHTVMQGAEYTQVKCMTRCSIQLRVTIE